MIARLEDHPKGTAVAEQIDAALASWSQEGFQDVYLWAFTTKVDGLLYEGDNASAKALLRKQWKQIWRIRKLVATLHRTELMWIYARLHLACGLNRKRRKHVLRFINLLDTEPRAWAHGFGRLLNAGVALSDGDTTAALDATSKARSSFEEHDMGAYAHLSRRVGAVLSGDDGAVARTDAWVQAQGVRAPEKMARWFFPHSRVAIGGAV